MATCTRCGQDAAETFHGECRACFVDYYDQDGQDDWCDPEGPDFECAGFNDGTGFYCPMWGSEECDWECPRGGLLNEP